LQSYLVAIIVIEPNEVKKWARSNNQDENDLAGIMKSEVFHKVVLDDLNRLATENKFSGLEKLKQLYFTD